MGMVNLINSWRNKTEANFKRLSVKANILTDSILRLRNFCEGITFLIIMCACRPIITSLVYVLKQTHFHSISCFKCNIHQNSMSCSVKLYTGKINLAKISISE